MSVWVGQKSRARGGVERVTLTTGCVRRLGRGDHGMVCAHLARLAADDRYARFSRPMNESALDNFCQGVSWLRTFLLGYFVSDEIRGLGELRLRSYRDPSVAELALSIERDFQNRGIGTELFRGLLLLARSRGVQRVWMQYRMENLRLRHIAARFGARITVQQGEAEGYVDLQSPSVLSRLAPSELPQCGEKRLRMDLQRGRRMRRRPRRGRSLGERRRRGG
jgi:RimJ/RimL family protein N-acetyltransferase